MLFRIVSVYRKCVRNVIEDIMKTAGAVNSSPTFAIPALSGATSLNKGVQTATDPISWDGILFAGLGGAPKHKPSLESRRSKKRDLRRWYKYIRSRHMFIPCDGCGGYHKKYHLCETCYDQTRYETHQVRKKLEEKGLDLSKETVVQYKDDNGRFNFGPNKQVLTVERNRPMGWFSQKFWGK